MNPLKFSLSRFALHLHLLLLLLPAFSNGQRLQYESMIEIVLNEDMNVVLFRTGDGNQWRYLPPSRSIRLSAREDGTPEFLYTKFTTEDRVAQGGIQGALLHCLLEWGLTKEQLQELNEKVGARTGGGQVAGPVDMEPGPGESFRITSAILNDKELTTTFVTSGMAPPMPGGKAAVAARLDKYGAQLLENSLTKSQSNSDITVVLDYEYTVLIKAAKGYLRYDLDISHSQGDGMAYDLMKKELDNQPELYQQALAAYERNKGSMTDECGVGDGMANVLMGLQAIDQVAGNTSGSGDTGSPWEYGVSESMLRKMYDYFESTEKIVMKWEETIDDDRLEVIREAFFNYFLTAFTEPTYPKLASVSGLENGLDLGDEEVKKAAQGGYKLTSCTKMEASRIINKEIRLDNITLPVRRRYQMVTNLNSTYDMVKNNPKCVSAVNLNDKFFQHRDINLIVDVEAMDIFEDEINYVTVNVRKRRSNGEDFSDAVTMSPAIMEEQGRLATITYARGEDTSPDLYEYKSQWSLRGGELYPANPAWVRGDWQAVTLQAPIRPRTIEFEGEIAELQEAGITRATLQLRYLKYGRETETNIPLTVSKGEPLVSGRIFTDRDQTGYAYRFIINHKEEGKLATPWEAKINDDYVYAVIPEGLREKNPAWLTIAKEAANVLLEPGPDGTVKPGEMILGKFKDLLNILIDN